MPVRRTSVLFVVALAPALAAGFALLCREPLFWAFHFEYAFTATLAVVLLSGPLFLVLAPRDGVWRRRDLRGPLGAAVLIPAVALLVVFIAQIVTGGCDPLLGLAWFALLPGVALIAATGTAAPALTFARTRIRAGILYGAIVAGCALWALTRIYAGPSFEAQSWLLGYWPGVLYDEYLPIEGDLLLGRAEALMLGVAGWLLAFSRRRDSRALALGSGTVLLLFAVLWAAEPLVGLHPGRGTLEGRLGGAYTGRHAEWIADASSERVRRALPLLVARYDFEAERIASELGLDALPPMRVYLFSGPRQKRIIGAEYTVVTRPWQGELFLHAGHTDPALIRHELVHLVAAEWGMPVLRISPNVALLEGLAVALAGPGDTVVSPEGLAAAVFEEKPDFAAARLVAGSGFWTFAPELAYPMAGSFVEWLRVRDPAALAGIYRSGEPGEGTSWSELADAWRAHLQVSVVPGAAARALARRVLAERPIFERRCPHQVAACLHSEEGPLWASDEGTRARLDRALELDPARKDVHYLLARVALAGGNADPIRELAPEEPAAEKAPSGIELRAASTLANWLLIEGQEEAALRWFEYLRRWTPELGTYWRASALAHLLRSEGRVVSFAGERGWTLTCRIALTEPVCAEADPAEEAAPFPDAPAEYAAASEAYEQAIAREEFVQAKVWAERMGEVGGLHPAFARQAERAVAEAAWLSENFRFYRERIRPGGSSPRSR